MPKWVIDKWTPYEGMDSLEFDSTKDAYNFLFQLSSYAMQECGYSIRKAPEKEYEPFEFLALVDKGEIT